MDNEWVRTNHPDILIKWKRVLFFDPTDIYDRIHDQINPYQRILSIPVEVMFPSIEGMCACGCGKPLEGRQIRWANEHCSSFAWDVRNIICNAHQRPTKYIHRYFGKQCMECTEELGQELDHIIGVKHGGGGCWLSNFKWVCKKCHRNKTNKDFGFKKEKI